MARNFNNSVKNMEQAENRIRNRGVIGQLMLMFFGGDQEAAETIENETAEMESELEELEEVSEETEEDVEETIKEQIAALRQQIKEMKELAKQERENKGIFGFLSA